MNEFASVFTSRIGITSYTYKYLLSGTVVPRIVGRILFGSYSFIFVVSIKYKEKRKAKAKEESASTQIRMNDDDDDE